MTFSLMTPVSHTVTSGTVVIWADPDGWDSQFSVVLDLFTQMEWAVQTLPQEAAVMQQVMAQPPDLLLIHLPISGDDGYALCERLRKWPKTRYLPVAFVGTRHAASERVNALRCGGNEYLQLPIGMEELWLRLARHLSTAQVVRRLEADQRSLWQQLWEYNLLLQQQQQQKASLAKENEVLQRLAFVDGLTQVANRRGFNKLIDQLWCQAYQRQQPLALLLCDIDYFKRYNDTYGHIAGDSCLRSVAAALTRGAHRQSDQVARYGGEEFAVLLPATDFKGAQKVALAIQSELAQAQLPHQASSVKSVVSLSIGACVLVPDRPDQSYELLVHGADEALYTAKLRGRDQMVIQSPAGLVSVMPTYCVCDYSHADSHCHDVVCNDELVAEPTVVAKRAINHHLSHQQFA